MLRVKLLSHWTSCWCCCCCCPCWHGDAGTVVGGAQLGSQHVWRCPDKLGWGRAGLRDAGVGFWCTQRAGPFGTFRYTQTGFGHAKRAGWSSWHIQECPDRLWVFQKGWLGLLACSGMLGQALGVPTGPASTLGMLWVSRNTLLLYILVVQKQLFIHFSYCSVWVCQESWMALFTCSGVWGTGSGCASQKG